ncbi:MAG: hypothetical protein IJ043_06150 [Clostridia bacterium]|nr:hypothetical protein [Clostridia bacterium]
MNQKISLNGDWNLTFTFNEKEYRCTAPVPGNIEPTLVRLGLVEDPMPADFLYSTEPFEQVDDWCYTTAFPAPETKHRVELVFEGIDTVAEICLNGETLGEPRNMHIAYRYDVTHLLKKENELKVVIRSAMLYAREYPNDMTVVNPGFPGYYDCNGHLRKARHQWGWDNAPRLVTSGIIRSVYLEEIAPVGFDEVYCYTTGISDEVATIGANWRFRTPEASMRGHEIRMTLLDGEGEIFTNTKPLRFTQGFSHYHIPLKDIKLWWPAGFGEPKLYTFRLEILKEGVAIARYETPFGIRTLELERTEDLPGEFVFRVNGEKVFARGTNWKPLSPLASEADARTRKGEALQELIRLHCNMVRVWGGGIYEDHFFYDFCDRHGIMVWQDFMLACEVPATDEAACRLYGEEAAYIVKKLRNHPSLALWCGDNESDKCNFWMQSRSKVLPSDNKITRQILREAVLRWDPYRGYMASSPYMADENYRRVQSGQGAYSQPETHFYANAVSFKESLRKNQSIFVGETGPMPVNAIAVNEKIFQREKDRAARLWDAPKLPADPPHHFDTLHQDDHYFTVWRNSGKEVCLARYGRDFTFGEFKDYTLAVNLACAEIYKDIIEYSRVVRWRKTGVLWWSLWDMWPMLYNYSVIDCDGIRKLPYYFIEKSQQEFCMIATREEIGGGMGLYAANDTLETHTAEYTVTAYGQAGNSRIIASGICRQGKNSTGLIQRLASKEPALWILHWKVNGKEYLNHAFTGDPSFETAKAWTAIIENAYRENFSETERK